MNRKPDQKPIMELKNIDKLFGITKALQQVNLDIYAGEVIGLVGPNGAGKSTLMKVITGVLSPTAGAICINGKQATRYTTKEAKELGVSCAYQDLSLCTNLSVYENFAMLNVTHTLLSKFGWRRKTQQDTKELLERFFQGNNIDVMKPVEALTLADRQIVEICKTLMMDELRILVLDEPTSALSSDKAAQLHQVVRQMSEKGIAVIYISHKLDEIKAISDRVVLMQNGKNNGECDPHGITTEELVQMMGGESKEYAGKKATLTAEMPELVCVRHYCGQNLNDVSITIKKGEILGLSGLVGSGQTELLNVIYKARKGRKSGGAVELNGTVSYVSGDRAKEGIFPLWDITDNILIANLNQVKERFLLSRKKSDALAQHWYDKLKFRAEGIHSPIMSLSGGNQQKALIARGIASGADVIILNDPTAGVDIETKQEIYGLLEEAKEMGKAIIFYSTEDAEIEICDRAYIMHEGTITQELVQEEITVANIVKASFKTVHSQRSTVSQIKSRLSALLHSRMLLPVLTMLVMIGVNAAVNPKILSYSSMRMLIGSAVPLVFAALGQMFIVVAGDIDMGNGYSIGLVNVIVATVLTGNPLMGVISLLLFIVVYALMGALIHIRNIPAIVVTLGAQFIWLGLALALCPTPGGTCPLWLSAIYKFKVGFLPMPVIICALAALFAWYVLYRAKYGMILRGIGNNAVSIERSGWSFLCAKMTNYALSGFMVVLSGMSFTAICLGADANSAASYCMMSIATVILGGCEMAGGVVEPVGVVAGAIAMSFITSLLTFIKVDSNYQTAVTGLILILVLVIKLFTRKKKGAQK